MYSRMWNPNVVLNHAETSDGKTLQSHVVLAIRVFMNTAPETLQNEMVFDPNSNEIKKRIQQLPPGERTINGSAAHIILNHAEKSQRALSRQHIED